jgi:hypothetical protein
MSFTYTGSEERIYPNILDTSGNVLVAIPNVTVLDTDPADGRWTASTPTPAPAEAPVTAPEAPVTDATASTEPTPTN